MNLLSHLPSRILLAALATALVSVPAWAVDSGSTGADGALNPTVNTEIQLPPSGVLNYTTVNIPAGVTVKFKRNTANTPVYLLASGDVTIAGTIDIRGDDAAPAGTAGDGAQGDDGMPGVGGPGGFSGGRGGRDDASQRAAVIRGGAGLGPGGGPGGVEGGNNCNSPSGYWPYVGVGGAYAHDTYKAYKCNGATKDHASAYGSSLLQPLVGGSGGGGGRGGTNYPGSGGGGGGGAILIASSGTVTLTGTINARGGDGGDLAGTGSGGRGAGGSGGAIRILASNITGGGHLYADGGCIVSSGKSRQDCGNNGGYDEYGGSTGRIRLEGDAINFTGSSSPTYVRGDAGPVFIANAPSLHIVSVAGKAVPAVPTGVNDVTLPATTTDAVAVVFQTTNVPIGNTVKLRIVPAYGTATETISPAITGTTAAGNAEVSVVLPQGPSTLQATTTYTVVVAATNEAMLDKLSRLAHNERVHKVQVTVALHGGAHARLITDAGHAYEVPYAALGAIGFQG